MSKEVWTRDQFNKINKSFHIYGPGDLVMEVDYDDVDHIEIQNTVDAMLVILNGMWGVKDDV